MEKNKVFVINMNLKALPVAVIILGVITAICGFFKEDLNVMTWGMLVVWLGNMIYAVENFQRRFFFFIFNCTFFTFILGRAFFGYFKGEEWWRELQQAYENNLFAVTAIILSLISIFAGAVLAELFFDRKVERKSLLTEKKKEFVINLQASALLVFYITMFFAFIQEGEKLVFLLSGKSYLDFYTSFQPALPSLVYTIASFMKYSLCIYLATMPRKWRAFPLLVLYILTGVPSFIIGMRNPVIQNMIFVLAYYVFRNITDNKEKWLGKFEKIAIAVAVPIGIVFLAAYAFIRSDMKIDKGVLGLFVDFFYGQGITINVLTRGYGYQYNLPQFPFRNYTFGGIIDYFLHGTVGQKIFGTVALPSYNCYENARMSNNLSHGLSYLILKDDYLNGQGVGSCYIMENYIDFGYMGVVLFSLLIGVLLIFFMRGMEKNVLVNTIILVSLTGIFYIPRAEATGWLTFICTAQFWVCVAGCYLAAWILGKWKWMRNLFAKLKIVQTDYPSSS